MSGKIMAYRDGRSTPCPQPCRVISRAQETGTDRDSTRATAPARPASSKSRD